MSRIQESLHLLYSVSRFHIVMIGALGTLTFTWLFSGHYLPILVFYSALDWFLVNIMNRVVDLPEDRTNRIHGTDFVARNARTILWLALLLLLGSLAMTATASLALAALRCCFHSLGFAYNWRLPGFKRRLKEFYFWKNSASALGFVLTVFLYPLSQMGWGLQPSLLASDITLWSIACALIFFVLFEISYEVIYDLRDVVGDREVKAQTYAVVHGEVVSAIVVQGCIAAALGVLVLGYGLGMVPWRLAVMGAAPLVQWVLFRRWFRRGILPRDCIVLTWIGASMLLVYHLWIGLGLPMEL